MSVLTPPLGHGGRLRRMWGLHVSLGHGGGGGLEPIFAIIVHFKAQTGPQRDSSREKDT